MPPGSAPSIPEGSSTPHTRRPASRANSLPTEQLESFSRPGREARRGGHFSNSFRCEGGGPSWTRSRGHTQSAKDRVLTVAPPTGPVSLAPPLPSPLRCPCADAVPTLLVSPRLSRPLRPRPVLLSSLFSSGQAHVTALVTHWSLALPGHRAQALVPGFWGTARVGISLTSHCSLEGLPLEDPVYVASKSAQGRREAGPRSRPGTGRLSPGHTGPKSGGSARAPLHAGLFSPPSDLPPERPDSAPPLQPRPCPRLPETCFSPRSVLRRLGASALTLSSDPATSVFSLPPVLPVCDVPALPCPQIA